MAEGAGGTTLAGWYPDPQADGWLRYWDGGAWTEHRSPQQRPVLWAKGIRPISKQGAIAGSLFLGLFSFFFGAIAVLMRDLPVLFSVHLNKTIVIVLGIFAAIVTVRLGWRSFLRRLDLQLAGRLPETRPVAIAAATVGAVLALAAGPVILGPLAYLGFAAVFSWGVGGMLANGFQAWPVKVGSQTPNEAPLDPVPPAPTPVVLPKHPKATTVLILGICGILLCSVVSPFVWVMGNRVVAEIDAGGGQLAGREEAHVGRLLGAVGTVMLIFTVVFIVPLFALTILRN